MLKTTYLRKNSKMTLNMSRKPIRECTFVPQMIILLILFLMFN